MADAIFQLRVNDEKFRNYREGDSPYDLLPPPGSKETIAVDNGHEYPTWHCGKDVSLHVGHYQKKYTYAPNKRIPTTIRLEANHAVLQLAVVDSKGQLGRYHPVGIAFSRADGTEPIGAPFTTGAQRVPIMIKGEEKESPFSKVTINVPPGIIEVDVERIAKLFSKTPDSHKVSHRTYRFIVFIQDLRTGTVGVIDPELEPPV